MFLIHVERLIRFVMHPGISSSELCKFLVLETLAPLKISAVYAAEITEDGYISPIGTFGISAQILSGWGNVHLSIHAPFTDAIKKDKVILLRQEESLEKYPILANYEGVPQSWESYLVCPILPHGLIALILDSTPKIDRNLELFLKTVGAITFQQFYTNQNRYESRNRTHPTKSIKKSGALTERQKSIKSLMENGLSNPAIAQEIGYSESLVRQETMAIYSTLNISGRKELLERKNYNEIPSGF
jgi:DNA-binding CsgD family transcriptional regulator